MTEKEKLSNLSEIEKILRIEEKVSQKIFDINSGKSSGIFQFLEIYDFSFI